MATIPGSHPKSGTMPILLVLLLLLLAALFHQSFSEREVLFANDAPLGQLKTQEGLGLSNFRGVWMDLNWIGSTQPSALPNVSNLLYVLGGPLFYAKFYAPVALLLLGLSAGLFLRQLGFHRAVCLLGGIAAVLSTDPFSYACWGLPSLPLTLTGIFVALAALVSGHGTRRWIHLALAGLAVGFSITEGFDNGAILSLYVAAVVVFQVWMQGGSTGQRVLKAAGQVALVAILAAFMAAQALSTLIGTQIQGVVGTQQDSKTKEQRWDEATMWSLPKVETLRVIIPGLFGYRMDTPDGGNYWGSVGQRPGVPQSRHSGAGVYAGVLVVLVAAWGLTRTTQRKDPVFSDAERRFVWFWGGVALVSLLLAYGRHAPFYQFFYKLPYFSTIRNPIKFMHPFTIAMVALFGFGLEGLWRRYLLRETPSAGSFQAQWKAWWTRATSFERRWVKGAMILVAASILGWLLYASSRTELERHLQEVGFEGQLATMMAKFSFTEVGWFVLFLALSVGALLSVFSGSLGGGRAKWAAWLFGLLLIADFARADAPWIIYYDYRDKYAANPVLDLLRQKPAEHRVAARLGPLTPAYLVSDQARGLFGAVAEEWLQHLFPYYRVQSLDIVQMPRMPEIDAAFLANFAPTSSGQLFGVGRLWQLTNTRRVLGMKGFLDVINQQLDPTNHSFRVETAFDFAPKPSATGSATRVEDITTVLRPEGQFDVFEYGAALPRAQLFDQWQVLTNETAVLQRLADPSFDPRRSVLLATPLAGAASGSGTNAGTVEITQYEAKRVRLQAQTKAPAVLLLNDKFDPNWHVTVDGRPAPLLRCNFIMRGVALDAGSHQVEFRFEPPYWTLYVSLAALAVAAGLCLFLALGPKSEVTAEAAASPRDRAAVRSQI